MSLVRVLWQSIFELYFNSFWAENTQGLLLEKVLGVGQGLVFFFSVNNGKYYVHKFSKIYEYRFYGSWWLKNN